MPYEWPSALQVCAPMTSPRHAHDTVAPGTHDGAPEPPLPLEPEHAATAITSMVPENHTYLGLLRK